MIRPIRIVLFIRLICLSVLLAACSDPAAEVPPADVVETDSVVTSDVEVDTQISDLEDPPRCSELKEGGLSALVPSDGTLMPPFEAMTTTYQLNLDLGVQQIAFTLSANNNTCAKIKVAEQPLDKSGTSHFIQLPVGTTLIPITVTEHDDTTRIYNLHVTRELSQQEAYIKSSNTGTGDVFGTVVSINANTLVVGAFEEDSSAVGVNGDASDNDAWNAGAAYVFTRNGKSWTHGAYLKASNTEANDHFGGSVAISNDTIVVGAYGEDSSAAGVNGDQKNNATTNSGAVYVFVRSNDQWTQQAYIKAKKPGMEANFGYAVAISGDTIAVGAYGEADAAGAVYIFVRTGTLWTQQAYIKGLSADADDEFGASLALHKDLLVVGAYGDDSNAQGVGGNPMDNSATESGAAYVFRRSGVMWSAEAYLKASNAATNDGFGTHVAVYKDTVVVGAKDVSSARI
ncbi:MAG TPA: hypothetical protein EYN66_01515 [Myxococcales bacterium]|nr:hypothetical protein [Myxococcales bacterium]